MFTGFGEKAAPIFGRSPSTVEEIWDRIESATETYTSQSDEDTFKAGTIFESFHHQAGVPLSGTALLAGFLMLWLKRCVVPSLPHEVLTVDVIYPAVLLAHGHLIGLLPAMVACLQGGLRVLVDSFCTVPKSEEEATYARDTPNPRVELPYTYLVAWFVMHCPSLMTAISPSSSDFVPFLQKLEQSK